MGVESHLDSQPVLGKPPSTPDMSARDAEAMVDSMLLDSPLPHSERANEEIPEGGGSVKLPEEGEGESFLKEAIINSLRRPLQVSL